MAQGFLPVSRLEMEEMGLKQMDFVYVSGDAYVDHPSFGPAIITRILEAHGYSVGFIAQPDFRDPESIMEFGEPKYAFLVSSGNMDSMVNHYTVAKKRRKTDAFTPGGVMGKRPDRAVIVYGNLIRKVYKKTPIILGGLEASLRRLAHYDYWSDSVRRSILLDSGADLISYGMGEHSIVEIADAIASGLSVSDITFIPGTVYKTRDPERIYDAIRLPDYEQVKSDRHSYAESFRIQYQNTDPFQAKVLYEVYDGALYVVQNTPAKPLTMMEMDDVYALPYTRTYHPMYENAGGIPAIKEIKFSISANRGCYGGCNFCALTFHQGRIMQARSKASIVEEAVQMTKDPEFKGYIHDIGGPTANFRAPACKKQLKVGACKHRQCLTPKPCPNLIADHREYLDILRTVRKLPKVKKVFVRSGIRFDYVMLDPDKTFMREICEHHISGQLRVAPEHVSPNVLALMGKPENSVYEEFVRTYEKINERTGREQYLVPYLMSSHPGSTLKDAITLAEYLHKNHVRPDQVQDFYPTPGTVSTCMYHTGLNPLTMEPVFVVKNPHEKALQRALTQYYDPDNYDLVKEALLREGRADLIGFGPECLIRPRKMKERGGDGRKHGGERKVSSGRKPGDEKKASSGGKHDFGKAKGGRPGNSAHAEKNRPGRPGSGRNAAHKKRK
ncbi:MAG: YgiQ family radical SAM protein [Lachnospiraceae bacterium]|nr:YgiQ family radical SAM protein [Lachnospiraceae bacterium]